jgi:vacuolar-type H+-ATPase subunit F/Vma7
MKKLKSKKNKWSAKKLLILENYVVLNKKTLVSNLYKNILVGYIRFPKPYGFFKKISKELKISSSKCMSKFYKFEKEFYLNLLGISSKLYCLFFSIRHHNKLDKLKRNLKKPNKHLNKIFSKNQSNLLEESKVENKSILNSIDPMNNNDEKCELFYIMNKQSIKSERLLVMHDFIAKKFKIEIKNKGESELILKIISNDVDEYEYITKLVKKTIEEDMFVKSSIKQRENNANQDSNEESKDKNKKVKKIEIRKNHK